MTVQVGGEEAQMRRCKELVGWPDLASHHHRGPTETSTNYTATGTSRWPERVEELSGTIATRLAL